MKKICVFVLALSLLLGLCACGGEGTTETSTGTDTAAAGGLRIVCTIFPIYDWVKNILGSDENVTMLLDSGVDLHSYQPTADDIITIAGCDLFIFVGGASDGWVSGVLESSGSGCRTLNLMEALSGRIREEEQVEGMQAEEEEHGDGTEYDEHIWLSVRNAAAACDAICADLGNLDPENASVYNARTAEYKAKLACMM
ncbi:MAG: metal ABC transporter substrate-binding protein [Clostridia bacterium]|nr:metal ABC transporter substrate-binding protein [Clostridia bacterium]